MYVCMYVYVYICRCTCHPSICVDYWTKELEAHLMLCSCTFSTCNVVHDVHVQCCACLIPKHSQMQSLRQATWDCQGRRRMFEDVHAVGREVMQCSYTSIRMSGVLQFKGARPPSLVWASVASAGAST